MKPLLRKVKPVLRAAFKEPNIRKPSDWPRVILFILGVDFVISPVVGLITAGHSPVQIWAEIAVMVLGGLCLRLWWEVAR